MITRYNIFKFLGAWVKWSKWGFVIFLFLWVIISAKLCLILFSSESIWTWKSQELP